MIFSILSIYNCDATAVVERIRSLAVEQGDRGYGAAVVKDGLIVAASPSRVVTRGDPTAHADTEVIRDAAGVLGTSDLSCCILYSHLSRLSGV